PVVPAAQGELARGIARAHVGRGHEGRRGERRLGHEPTAADFRASHRNTSLVRGRSRRPIIDIVEADRLYQLAAKWHRTDRLGTRTGALLRSVATGPRFDHRMRPKSRKMVEMR